MKWLQKQLGTIVTLTTLLIGVGIAYGHLEARQVSLERSLSAKVDREPVMRELDQVHRELADIQRRLDGLIIRQAIVADR